MQKTEILQYLETLAWMNLPCSVPDWRQAVIENPNFMQEEYDHLVKFESIPEEIHLAHSAELMAALQPLEVVLQETGPSPGIIYIVQHPEYQQEWDANWKKREELRALQHDERLKIYRRLHRKYYYEYGIAFNSKLVW